MLASLLHKLFGRVGSRSSLLWLGLSVARLGSRCIKNQPHQDLKGETILSWVSSSHPPNHLKLDQNCQDIAIYICIYICIPVHLPFLRQPPHWQVLHSWGPWRNTGSWSLAPSCYVWNCTSAGAPKLDMLLQPMELGLTSWHWILKQLWRVCSTRPVTSWRVCPKANWKIPTTSGRVGSEDVYAMSAHAVTCRTFLGKSENIYSKKCISNLRGHCGLCVKQERVNIMN